MPMESRDCGERRRQHPVRLEMDVFVVVRCCSAWVAVPMAYCAGVPALAVDTVMASAGFQQRGNSWMELKCVSALHKINWC